jgi:hypothetical protein
MIKIELAIYNYQTYYVHQNELLLLFKNIALSYLRKT